LQTPEQVKTPEASEDTCEASEDSYLDRGQNQRVDAHGSSEAEVAQLNDCSLAEQNVLWLHVAV